MDNLFEHSDIIITDDLTYKVYGKGNKRLIPYDTKYANDLIEQHHIQMTVKQEYVRDYHCFVNINLENTIYHFKSSILLLMNKQDINYGCYQIKFNRYFINQYVHLNKQFINHITSYDSLYNARLDYGQKLPRQNNKQTEITTGQIFLYIMIALTLFYASLDYLSR